MKRHLEKATESFNATHSASEPFPTSRQDEFSVFSGMTSTVRAATSAPLSSVRLSSGMRANPSPTLPQETHHSVPGVLPQGSSQPVAPPQLPSQPPSTEAGPSPRTQVPSLSDQLVSFEAQITPSPAVGGYTHALEQQYESPHTPNSPFPFTSTRSVSPPMPAYLQPVLPGHMPQHTEGPPPVLVMPDRVVGTGVGGVYPRWAIPRMDMQPQLVHQHTLSSSSHTADHVLQQGGSLSLTEVWSQLIMQMDIVSPGSQQPS
jgi:hypothetical protein